MASIMYLPVHNGLGKRFSELVTAEVRGRQFEICLTSAELSHVLAQEEYGIGILVDSVSEVLNIKGGDIEDAPNFGTRLNTNYILGMAKTGGRVKILLEIDKVLSDGEFAALSVAV